MAVVPKKGGASGPKKAAMALLAVAILIAISFALYSYYTASLGNLTAPVLAPPAGKPGLSAAVASQDILSYSNSTRLLPYVLLSYRASNVSLITVNVTVFKSRPPSGIYILNTSDECFGCGSTADIERAFASSLVSYGIIKDQSGLSLLEASGIAALPNDSIVIILSGLLPEQLLMPVAGISPMQLMLNKGTSIIYVGQDFSRLLLPGSIIVPTSSTIALPSFLQVAKASHNSTKGFIFNESTFAFANGTNFGSITYTNVANGSIVAFSDTPDTWLTPEGVGRDLAKVIQELFWPPRYSTGSSSTSLAGGQNETGSIGILGSGTGLNQTHTPSYLITKLNSGYARAAISANSVQGSNTIYEYIYFKPKVSSNGTIAVGPSIIANQQAAVGMTIFTHSTTPIPIQPHLSVYTLDMVSVMTIPLPFTSASNNFTFVKYTNFYLGPGRYILSLDSFNNSQYAAAYLNVSPISATLSSANFSSGTFVISLKSAGQPLSDIYYNVTLNGLYRSSGVVRNGIAVYSLPKGTPTIYGNITLSMSMLSQQFKVVTYNAPTVISIDKQYIELAIVGIAVLLMIVLVRAPNRDEFYIDVPSLPEQKKTNIKLNAKEVLSAFDRLNLHYHWRYMPLSDSEVRIAISNNIRYNNMPVSLTYSNIEAMLNKLSEGGYLVGADELYAPKAWLEQSGHDIEYLATFKKLRLYLVTHSYIFTDMDSSAVADIVATLRNQRKYIIIYSDTTKFKRMPVYPENKTYLAFMNQERLEDFKSQLYGSMTKESEMLKLYISAGLLELLDADNPSPVLG